jgi:hypothetical protein
VITGQACLLINGVCAADSETPAFLAIPQGDSLDFSTTESASAHADGPADSKAAVPKNIRQQFLQRHGLRLQAGTAIPQ